MVDDDVERKLAAKMFGHEAPEDFMQIVAEYRRACMTSYGSRTVSEKDLVMLYMIYKFGRRPGVTGQGRQVVDPAKAKPVGQAISEAIRTRADDRIDPFTHAK